MGRVCAVSTPLLIATGFGPFGEVERNPSGELALELGANPPPRTRVAATVLPVTFEGVPGALREHVDGAGAPKALLSMGVHPGAGFRLERRARAAPTSKVLDNLGRTGAAYAADRARVSALELEPLRAKLAPLADELATSITISDDAGGYVCDWTYQQLLQHGERLRVPALFLHVPQLELLDFPRQLILVRALVGLLLAT